MDLKVPSPLADIDRTIMLSPRAMSKLAFWKSVTDNELSGMGICDDPNDPCLITDVELIKQKVSIGSIELDDDAIVDFDARMHKLGLEPRQYMRVWIHTHPGKAFVTPSGTDIDTFEKILGKADWSVMLIVAEEKIAAHVHVAGFPKLFELPVNVDWLVHYDGPDFKGWRAEIKKLVKEKVYPKTTTYYPAGQGAGQGPRTFPDHCGGYRGESYRSDIWD